MIAKTYPPLTSKLVVDREPGEIHELDVNKRTYLVATKTGFSGRSNSCFSEAALRAIKSGARPTESGIAITIIGDDSAFIQDDGDLNYSSDALNCGSVPISMLAALVA